MELTEAISTPIYSTFRDDLDFREILEDFVTSVRDQRAKLTAAWVARDWGALRTQSHQLKGAGGSYGFEELSRLAADFEAACRESAPSIDESGRLLELLIEHLGQIAV